MSIYEYQTRSVIVYRIFCKQNSEKYNTKIVFNFAEPIFILWQVFSILKRQRTINVLPF